MGDEVDDEAVDNLVLHIQEVHVFKDNLARLRAEKKQKEKEVKEEKYRES